MADVEASVIVAPIDPLIGQTIGAYVVKELLGDGGMAQVYLAEHQTIGRKMAVKVLRAEVAAQREWHERFIAEAQVIAALKHRNIVEVFDFGQLADGRQFIMMEYVQGEPLDTYVTQHAPLSPAIALDFADQILNALGEAHKKGIVHRDLKPGNVMLVREHNNEPLLKVLDFGLARQDAVVLSTEPGQDSAKASLLAGTPAYVAPEQALGEVVDGRADLYALGVMLFEMLAGRLPFDAPDDRGLVEMHVSTPAPPLDGFVSNLPDGLSRLVASLLAKSRDERPASADAARQAVQRVIKQLRADATALRPMPAPPRAQHALPTQKIDRVTAPSQGPTTDLALAAAKPSPWPRRLAVVAGLAVLMLIVAVWPDREIPSVVGPVPPPPPEAPIKQAEPAPETPQPPEVTPLPETPAPLPVVKPEPAKPPVKPQPVKSVPVVELTKCEPDDDWRRSARADLDELTQRSAHRDDLLVWAAEESDSLSHAIAKASSTGECLQVEQRLRAFNVRLKSTGGGQ